MAETASRFDSAVRRSAQIPPRTPEGGRGIGSHCPVHYGIQNFVQIEKTALLRRTQSFLRPNTKCQYRRRKNQESNKPAG